MSDWEEIVRLQQDLERVQSTGAAQRLSERNCVEIVMKLLEMNLIDVIFTTDGKEYLTPQHLCKEIRDELYVSGGRLSLVDLASLLSLDYSHVEQAAQTITKTDRSTHLVLGQLLSSHYLEQLCRQVNERLQQLGTVALPSLTKEFDLPTDFLVEQVHARLGSIIEGFKDDSDPKVLLTTGHVARNRAKVRGVLSAVTVPTSVSSIIARTVAKATYVPHSYARAQAAWVEDFLASNGYLEYDSVARLGLSEPVQYVKKKFPQLTYLSSCCLSSSLVDQLEVSLEEALSSCSWLEVAPLLPSVLGKEDARQLVQNALNKRASRGLRGGAVVLGDCCVVSHGLVSAVVTAQEAGMEERAARDVESGAVAQSLVDQGIEEVEEGGRDRKEERRKKAAGGSAGGGAQGRQTKTKSTKDKKKGAKVRDEDWSDEEEPRGGRGGGGGGGKGGGRGGKAGKGAGGGKTELVYKSIGQLQEELRDLDRLTDCPEEVYLELAEQVVEQLNRKYKEVARDRLGEKAVSEFTSEDHRTSLRRHLLKECGTELVNDMLQYVAEENLVKVEQELTTEARLKVIGHLPKEISEPAMKVHKAVLGSSVADFIAVLEACVSPLCDVLLRKPDKKKDRQILFGHRQSLQEKLHQELDPAMVAVLVRHQKLVVAGLGKAAADNEEDRRAELEGSTPAVKELVAGFKRTATE